MTKSFSDFKYMSFDIVGTLIDFERGMLDGLTTIADQVGVSYDKEEMLVLYREKRAQNKENRFPDHLEKIYMEIAPQIGLPQEAALAEQWKNSAHQWPAFADSAAALKQLAKTHRLIAMTNSQHWAYASFEATLGKPFYASFTTDLTGTEKPDPVFFETVFDFVASEGNSKEDILHVAQSQYHDIGISKKLGMTNCWIERRHGQKGYGGTIEPESFTEPDYHFTSMADFAAAVEYPSAHI